jgi:hypothetical protein
MSELTPFTFRDTGITVMVKKISPMIMTDVNNAMPPPEPPMQEVDYGEPRGKVMEKNLSDPAYAKILAAHNQKVFQAIQRVMILRGVVVNGTGWKKEVAEYRAFMLETTGKPVEETNDLIVYIMRICVGTEEDLEDFVQAITRRSQPTDMEVEKAKESFRG